jgi:hypothetical protein
VRRILLPLVLLGLAASLAACGVSGTVDPVAKAASKTQQAGGARIAFTLSISNPLLASPVEINGQGEFKEQQGDLTLDLAPLLRQSGVSAGTDGTLRELFLQENGDDVIYMNFPFLSSQVPGGKTWIRLDLQKVGEKLGVDFNQLTSQAGQNPAQALDMLRASGDVQELGQETIDGVSTTHYKATVDLAQASKLKGLSESAVKRLTDLGAPAKLPFDVWIGDDGLLRQVKTAYSLASGELAMTMKLSDYGTDVSVTAPPADQVFDATALAASKTS